MDFSGDKPGCGGIQVYLLPDYWWWIPVVGGKYETKKVLLGQSVRFKWLVHCPSRVHQAVQDRKHTSRWEKHWVLISIQSVMPFNFRLNNLQFVFVHVLQRGDVVQRDGGDGHVLQTWQHPDIRHLWTRTKLRSLLLLRGSLPLSESWLQCLWQLWGNATSGTEATVTGNHRRKWLGLVLKCELQLQSQPRQRRKQGMLFQPNLSKTTPNIVPVAAVHCR